LPVWKKALLVALASAFVAVVVYAESALQTPTYEATAVLLVGSKEPSDGKIRLIPNALPPERLWTLAHMTARAVETRPVAERVIKRLGLRMTSDELLADLTVEQVESSEFIRLTYTDTDPGRTTQVVNAVGSPPSASPWVTGRTT
jgi:capsular polysaccharide biosynthesis protein